MIATLSPSPGPTCAVPQPQAPSTPELEVHSSFDSVRGLRAEWDRLAELAGADLYGSFDWCALWWKHFHQNRELELYVARVGGGLVACVPLYRETLSYGPWRLHLVRMVGSGDAGTRCHLPVRGDMLQHVLTEICRRVDRGGGWDILHFGDLPGNSSVGLSTAQALGRAFPSCKVIFRSGHYPASIYELPDSFEAYLKRLSPKERSSIRRTERRLKEDHQAQIVPTSPAELDEVFDHFMHQHEDWWGRKGHLGYFRIWPGLVDFHRELSATQAANGRLHLLRLKAGNEPIGYYYAQSFGRRVHAFSGARSCDPQWDALSPGKQLHCAMVRTAIESGMTQIDSGDGFYQYKQLWGATFHRLQAVTVLSERMSSRLARRDFASVARIHHLWNRFWFWHMAPWLRRKFPAAKISWMRCGLGSLYVRSRFLEYAADSCAADAICFLGAA